MQLFLYITSDSEYKYITAESEALYKRKKKLLIICKAKRKDHMEVQNRIIHIKEAKSFQKNP